ERPKLQAGVDQAEEQQCNLRGISPGELEAVERVLRVRLRVHEKSRIARGMREKGHDRNERERWMKTGPEERVPGRAAGGEQIRPGAFHARSPQNGCDAERQRDDHCALDEMEIRDRLE